MQRILSCLLVVLPPCAWAVASDYNYDINYYNDYELFDKGYQYDDHDAPPEYVSPYAGSYDDEVRRASSLHARTLPLLLCSESPWNMACLLVSMQMFMVTVAT